jgi:hypothetical protein
LSYYWRRFAASCQTARLHAPKAIASTITAIMSTTDGPRELEEAESSDARSARLTPVVDTGLIVVKGPESVSIVEGGRVSVVEGGRVSMGEGARVTAADAVTSVVVDEESVAPALGMVVVAPMATVVVVLARVVVVVALAVVVVAGLVVVVVGLTVVVVGLTVVVVGLTVVVVARWQLPPGCLAMPPG